MGTVSHTAPLFLLSTPRADAEDHPISVLPNLDASAGQKSSRGGTWGDRSNTSAVPKVSWCLDTLEVTLHRGGRHRQGLLSRQIVTNTKDAKFGLKAAQHHPPGYYWIWDSYQFHGCILRSMAGAQLAEISVARLRGSIVRASDTDPDLCPSTNNAVHFQGALGSAQLSPLQRSLQEMASPIHTGYEHRKGGQIPACVLLAGSSFMAHLPATAVSVSQLPALPLPLLCVDKRLSLGMTCWETEDTSSARLYGMVVSAVGKKPAFWAAEFAGISKCQFTDWDSSRMPWADGSYFYTNSADEGVPPGTQNIPTSMLCSEWIFFFLIFEF